MVSEIRIYVEGGGDTPLTQLPVREGFSKFLIDLKSIADQKRIGFSIIACGARGNAKNDFFEALESHPDDFNVLLVDSENQVISEPWKHLKNQDNWDLNKNHDENCHLMVQVVESWLIADVKALREYYGNGFDEEKLPKETDIEMICKRTVINKIRDAIQNTEKGKYHKINDCPKILALLNTTLVRERAPHCDRLFTKLTEKMETSS